jgi:hypothetical protein
MQSIHFDIKPFTCLIRGEFLFDFQSNHGKYYPCKVFAVSSYPGHVPTFQVLVEDKYLYSYVPVHALVEFPIRFSGFMEEYSYFNCPSGQLTVHTFESLDDEYCQVYNKDGSWRGVGSYMMTFDWQDDNQLCHLINQGGCFMLWPSHKIIFSTDKTSQLPGYKKIHSEWKLK